MVQRIWSKNEPMNWADEKKKTLLTHVIVANISKRDTYEHLTKELKKMASCNRNPSLVTREMQNIKQRMYFLILKYT